MNNQVMTGFKNASNARKENTMQTELTVNKKLNT